MPKMNQKRLEFKALEGADVPLDAWLLGFIVLLNYADAVRFGVGIIRTETENGCAGNIQSEHDSMSEAAAALVDLAAGEGLTQPPHLLKKALDKRSTLERRYL